MRFNSFDKRTLLNKLEYYGIRGRMKLLIKPHTARRKHLVNFGKSSCEKLMLEYLKGQS